jgi:hypothetical protein
VNLFQRHHYAAFDPPKPGQDDPGTRSEREAVHDALLELHEMLWPLIKRERWDLHHHWYEPAIVSSFHFVPRIVHHISAMWLSYGKSKEQLDFLKTIGGFDRRNPHLVDDYDGFYHHARIQFLVRSSAFECWLLLATHTSAYDRAYFLDQQLMDQSGKDTFWRLVQPVIDKGFSYQVTDVTVEPEKTKRLRLDSRLSQSELIKFVKRGRDGFYSGIVKEYRPDDPALDVSRIRDAMIANVMLLAPLYRFMAWRPGRR